MVVRRFSLVFFVVFVSFVFFHSLYVLLLLPSSLRPPVSSLFRKYSEWMWWSTSEGSRTGRDTSFYLFAESFFSFRLHFLDH